MTYAEVEQLIETTATAVLAGDGGYMHARPQDQSKNYNGPKRKIYLESLRFRNDYKDKVTYWVATIGFLEQDTVGSSPVVHKPMVDRMWTMYSEFAKAFYQADPGLEVQSDDGVEAIQKLTQVMTGVAVKFTMVTVSSVLC